MRFATPSPQSSHRSSPIPEVYNTPNEEQELSYLLEVLSLDDVTPEGEFINSPNAQFLDQLLDGGPTSVQEFINDTSRSPDLYTPELFTLRQSSNKLYRSTGSQTTTSVQESAWVQPAGPSRRSPALSATTTSPTYHPLLIDPYNPPVYIRRPQTVQHQGTVFVKKNVDAFPPETFLNQTVYFYNAHDGRPQRVAVTSVRVYYDDFCFYKRPYEFHIRGRIDNRPWPELY